MKLTKLSLLCIAFLLILLINTFTVESQEAGLQLGSAIVQGNKILIKAEAKTRSPTLATVNTGEFVQILQVGEKWVQIQDGDITGWLPVGSLANAEPSIYDLANLLPAPTGSYGIGRITTDLWIDESRPEEEPTYQLPHPILQARIWYPADVPSDAVLAPYVDIFAGTRGNDALTAMGLSPEIPAVQHLLRLPTHTYQNVPVSNQQPSYPVILFFVFQPEGFTAQIEELVSHGYIVVGLSRAYYYGELILPTGEVVIFDSGIASSHGFNESLLGRTDIGVGDAIYALNQLTTLNAVDPAGMLTGRLDLNHIGLVGYDFSATLANIGAQSDQRFRALVNLDGISAVGDWSNPYIPTTIQQPYLYINRIPDVYANTSGPSYTATIPAFTHKSFMDLLYAQVVNQTLLGEFGMFDQPRRIDIVRAYIGAFFDTYLKNQPNALLTGSSADYPEVSLYSNNTE